MRSTSFNASSVIGLKEEKKQLEDFKVVIESNKEDEDSDEDGEKEIEINKEKKEEVKKEKKEEVKKEEKEEVKKEEKEEKKTVSKKPDIKKANLFDDSSSSEGDDEGLVT